MELGTLNHSAVCSGPVCARAAGKKLLALHRPYHLVSQADVNWSGLQLASASVSFLCFLSGLFDPVRPAVANLADFLLLLHSSEELSVNTLLRWRSATPSAVSTALGADSCFLAHSVILRNPFTGLRHQSSVLIFYSNLGTFSLVLITSLVRFSDQLLP